MTKRNFILTSVLGISYLVVMGLIFYQFHGQVNLFTLIVFGIVLFGVAILCIRINHGGSSNKGISRILKVLFASYAIAFALWMLGSVLMLPVIGYSGFLYLENSFFSLILLCGALLVSPLVARKLA